MKKSLALVVAASSFALAVSGCSSSQLQQAANGASSAAGAASAAASQAGAAVSSAVAAAPVVADPALKAKLPKKVQDAGKIIVGVDSTYPPNESLDADGKTVVGMDVELFDAVAARMGVKTEWQSTQFASILNGIAANKYDAGVSSFTITKDRLASVNMVSYLSVGTQWVVPKGNPKAFVQTDSTKWCGMSLAVQKGTTQEDEVNAANAKCAPDKKITPLVFDDQGMVTNALVSGRAAAMAADTPIALYAVKQNSDKIEPLGDVYGAAPYGFVVNKSNTDFAAAIAQATKDIKTSGQYDAILAKYGVSKAAINDFQVNPAVS